MALTLEQLWRPIFRGPLQTKTNSQAGQWAGRTTLNSGSVTVVISTTNVNSDSLILTGLVGNANVASGTAIHGTEVKTISPGGYFTLGTMDGIGIARDTIIMWTIVKAS